MTPPTEPTERTPEQQQADYTRALVKELCWVLGHDLTVWRMPATPERKGAAS